MTNTEQLDVSPSTPSLNYFISIIIAREACQTKWFGSLGVCAASPPRRLLVLTHSQHQIGCHPILCFEFCVLWDSRCAESVLNRYCALCSTQLVHETRRATLLALCVRSALHSDISWRNTWLRPRRSLGCLLFCCLALIFVIGICVSEQQDQIDMCVWMNSHTHTRTLICTRVSMEIEKLGQKLTQAAALEKTSGGADVRKPLFHWAISENDPVHGVRTSVDHVKWCTRSMCEVCVIWHDELT